MLAGPDFVASAREVAAAAPQPLRVVAVGEEYEAFVACAPAIDPGESGAGDDPVLQMYTSGTTGVPKGVLTTHRNLAAACLNAPVWSFDADSVSLTPLPMFHVGGLGWTYLGLSQGATTILVSEFDAAAVMDQLESERVTNAVFVPTILQLLTAVPGAADRDFSALRSIAYGASPITTPVLKAALRTFDCELFGVYGLTETTGGVVLLSPEDHQREELLRAAGRPSPWMELRVVDGEVWLRGPNVMAGYANRPAETAAALTDDGWLRTGDGGYLDAEGYLFLTDRIKDMIVSGAENVYPVEVEEALSQHPSVDQVAVIGVPDERWGEIVTALIVPRPGSEITPEELIAFARLRLAGYKLPRRVEFVSELPRTPTGKVLKHELRARYATDGTGQAPKSLVK
jgi:long-chain acyl-CoA synthetase